MRGRVSAGKKRETHPETGLLIDQDEARLQHGRDRTCRAAGRGLSARIRAGAVLQPLTSIAGVAHAVRELRVVLRRPAREFRLRVAHVVGDDLLPLDVEVTAGESDRVGWNAEVAC